MEVHLNASATQVGNDQAHITAKMKEVSVTNPIAWNQRKEYFNWFSWFFPCHLPNLDWLLGGLRSDQSVQFVYGKAKTLLNIRRTVLQITPCDTAAQPMQRSAQSEYREHGNTEQYVGYRRSIATVSMENHGRLDKMSFSFCADKKKYSDQRQWKSLVISSTQLQITNINSMCLHMKFQNIYSLLWYKNR